MESRVETTRGSNTTVKRPERAFPAPSIRIARSNGVGRRPVGVEVAEAPPHAEPAAGLGVGALAGDGRRPRGRRAVRRVAARMPVVEASATSTLVVAVVGRVHLADPGVGRPDLALEVQGQLHLAIGGGGTTAGVPQVELGRGHPVGHGQGDVGVGGGEARRCRGLRPASTSTSSSSSDPAHAKPTRLPPVAVEEHPDADAGRGRPRTATPPRPRRPGSRCRGPGPRTPRSASPGPASVDQGLGRGQQVAHVEIGSRGGAPHRDPGDPQRRLTAARPARSGRPCRRCRGSWRSRCPRRRSAAGPRARCRSGWRPAAAR